MTRMIEVNTAELIGPALDGAVAVALGWQMRRVPKDIDGQNGGEVLAPPDLSSDFQFPPRGKVAPWYFVRRWSTDWSQGGPLLDMHCKSFGLVQERDGRWRAFGYGNGRPFDTGRQMRLASGPTILIAACRAIVAAKLGDVVQVPAELVGGV